VVIQGRSSGNRLRVTPRPHSNISMFYAGPEDAGRRAEARRMLELIAWFLDAIVWGA